MYAWENAHAAKEKKRKNKFCTKENLLKVCIYVWLDSVLALAHANALCNDGVTFNVNHDHSLSWHLICTDLHVNDGYFWWRKLVFPLGNRKQRKLQSIANANRIKKYFTFEHIIRRLWLFRGGSLFSTVSHMSHVRIACNINECNFSRFQLAYRYYARWWGLGKILSINDWYGGSHNNNNKKPAYPCGYAWRISVLVWCFSVIAFFFVVVLISETCQFINVELSKMKYENPAFVTAFFSHLA